MGLKGRPGPAQRRSVGQPELKCSLLDDKESQMFEGHHSTQCGSVSFHEDREEAEGSSHPSSREQPMGSWTEVTGQRLPSEPLPEECGVETGATRDEPVCSVHKIGYNYPLLFLLSVKKLPMWGGGAVGLLYCN